MQGVWPAHPWSMRERNTIVGRKEMFLRGLPLLKFFVDVDLCSLGLTLKGIILAAHVVYLDNLAALISSCVYVRACACVYVCVCVWARPWVFICNSICLGEWALGKGTCCDFTAARIQKEIGLTPLGALISHLRRGRRVSEKLGQVFFVLHLNLASCLAFLSQPMLYSFTMCPKRKRSVSFYFVP